MTTTEPSYPARRLIALPVSALGVRRRIHALQAIGYSYRDLGDHSGIRPESFRRLTDVPQVLGRSGFLITELYDQSGTPGPSRLSDRRLSAVVGFAIFDDGQDRVALAERGSRGANVARIMNCCKEIHLS
ncbi:hypothetical protein [Nocardia sp. NPDC004123]